MKMVLGSADHGPIFTLLVILVLLATGISLLHLPAPISNILVLAIGFVMATLVLGDYMGLKFHGYRVVWLFFLPSLALFTILVVMLLPDIAHVPFTFLGKF